MTAKHPSAFVNAIAEGRNFDEAIAALQDLWDRNVDLKAELNAALSRIPFATQSITSKPSPSSTPRSGVGE
jgi:hypothetical protein